MAAHTSTNLSHTNAQQCQLIVQQHLILLQELQDNAESRLLAKKNTTIVAKKHTSDSHCWTGDPVFSNIKISIKEICNFMTLIKTD